MTMQFEISFMINEDETDSIIIQSEYDLVNDESITFDDILNDYCSTEIESIKSIINIETEEYRYN